MPLNHSLHVVEPYEKPIVLTFESQLQKIELFNFPTYILSPKHR